MITTIIESSCVAILVVTSSPNLKGLYQPFDYPELKSESFLAVTERRIQYEFLIPLPEIIQVEKCLKSGGLSITQIS